MKLKALLKILNATLKIPITLLNSKFEIQKSYPENIEFLFLYDLKNILCNFNQKFFKFFYGNFNEVFIVYKFQDYYIIFGPFRCNIIDKDLLHEKLKNLNIRQSDYDPIYRYLDNLSFFSLSDCKSILLLIHHTLTGNIEDLFKDSLNYHISVITQKVNKKTVDLLISQSYTSEDLIENFEKKLLDIVKDDIPDPLSNISSLLYSCPPPIITGDTLRSEKNYSIVLLEKLSNAALQIGLDPILAVQSRNKFIKESEYAKNLNDVLMIRESGIVFYIKKINDIKKGDYPYPIVYIMKYIKINLHKNITINEIAKQFKMCNSHLCTIFKKEVHITLKQYILEQKISASKIMIKEAYSINDIALSLGFSDASHFSRTFKRITGKTPKQFKNSL